MLLDALDRLFEPFSYKNLRLRNRIVMAPMSRYFSIGGIPGDDMREYYRRRAEGEVGLILSEGAFIDRAAARSTETVPSFSGDALHSWGEIADAVKAAGAAMGPQLWHVGGCPDFIYPDDAYSAKLESPSGLRGPDMPSGKPMTEEDIADAIGSFARGAAQAQQLGFDCVEFHGAHGYLFDQFFWAVTNRRWDRFGGASLAERSRFAIEVIKAARREVGNDFVLLFRLSQWKMYDYEAKLAKTPDELHDWVGPLADAGVDIFDCSQRRFWTPEFEGSDLNLAGWVKNITGRPTMTVGSVGLSTDLRADFETGDLSKPAIQTIVSVAERLDRGEFDLVGVGRALLSDPRWAQKVRERRLEDLQDYSIEAMQSLT